MVKVRQHVVIYLKAVSFCEGTWSLPSSPCSLLSETDVGTLQRPLVDALPNNHANLTGSGVTLENVWKGRKGSTFSPIYSDEWWRGFNRMWWPPLRGMFNSSNLVSGFGSGPPTHVLAMRPHKDRTPNVCASVSGQKPRVCQHTATIIKQNLLTPPPLHSFHSRQVLGAWIKLSDSRIVLKDRSNETSAAKTEITSLWKASWWFFSRPSLCFP